MSRSLEVAAVCAIPAATVVLVLPGFALRAAPETLRKLGAPRWAVGRAAGEPVSEPRAAALVLALALSLCFAVGVGGTLLALGIFSPTLLALLSGLTALAGLVPFLRWCREGVRGLLLHVALVVALAVPISVSFFGGGYRPAQSYQWFYWGLGRQLSDANGVPDHVLEWGRAVRWQPDYLNFNLVSQAYIGLMRGVSEPMAVAAWRLPLAVGVLAMTFLVLRLWFTFLPAAVTTAALSATGLYIDKIGNNSPEALGITFGLVSVWLVVQAIRLRRRSWLMLGAVTIALTLSVHGIAATVLALLLIAAALVELVATRASPSRWVPALLVAAVTSGLVVASLGLALQGRTSPLGDAKRPAKIGALDPTYQFIQYSNGHFGTSVNHNSLRRLVTSPWRGVDLTLSSWWWLVALVAVGVVGALLLRPGRASRGVVTALVFGVLVAGAVAWFQLRYHTYVPQHTGNARIAQYAPLVYAFGLAAGLQVVVHLLTGLSSRRVGPGLRSGAAWVAAGVAILAFAPTTTQVMAGRPALPAVGVDALAELRSSAAPGSVVVSNVATRGTVEFFSGLENPLEGRQPLIEDLPTLTSATSYLRRMHEFLVDPHHGQLQQQLGASWLLLADSSGDLGTTLDYGTPAPHFARRSGLEVVWQQGGMSLLRVAGDVAPVASVGPHQVLWPKFLAALAVLLAGCAALALGLAWVDRRFAHRHRRDPTPAR